MQNEMKYLNFPFNWKPKSTRLIIWDKENVAENRTFHLVLTYCVRTSKHFRCCLSFQLLLLQSFAWFYKSMSSCLNNRSWFTSSTLWLRVAKQSINREREHSLLPSQPPKFVLDSPGETTYLCFGGRSVRFSRLLFNGHPLIYCLFILLLGT